MVSVMQDGSYRGDSLTMDNKKGRKRKKYCSCGHSETSHYHCDCPDCGAEHCKYGCQCELRDKFPRKTNHGQRGRKKVSPKEFWKSIEERYRTDLTYVQFMDAIEDAYEYGFAWAKEN